MAAGTTGRPPSPPQAAAHAPLAVQASVGVGVGTGAPVTGALSVVRNSGSTGTQSGHRHGASSDFEPLSESMPVAVAAVEGRHARISSMKLPTGSVATSTRTTGSPTSESRSPTSSGHD